MWFCYVFYFVQILLGIWIFRSKAELAIYTNLFVIFYSIAGMLCGYFLFSEQINAIQYVGILLGLLGAILMTTGK